MKKAIILLFIIAALAGGGYYLKANQAKTAAAAQAAQADPTAQVQSGPIKLSVASNGKVVSNLDVEIKCKSSGTVTTLTCDISDPVKAGDLLVAMDPIDENRKVSQTRVDLAASKAKLEQSKLNLKNAEQNLVINRERAAANLQSAKAHAEDAKSKDARMKALFEKGRVSQEDYDTAHTSAIQAEADVRTAQAKVNDLVVEEQSLDLRREDIKLAESQVESDQINLDIAQQRLKETVVYSPMDGVVSARNVQIGQIISSTISNVGGGTALFTLSDLSRIFVLASVDESDIGRIALGQDATIRADAFPGRQFRGKVVRIATKGVSSSNVVTFEVKIEVQDEKKSLLKPEMTTNIEVVAAAKDEALLVPSTAILRKQRGQIVRIPVPDKDPEERAVTVGIDNGMQAEVLTGLKEGETVIAPKTMDSKWAQGNRQGGRPPAMMMMGGPPRR
ncbi:MAG: efflux RND transporter periplasmic adaptor subunit [Candidatus Sumerlaeota bacterium]|nr:efflux RND transporter periplasmic adaptor subunit [Candidatus Sumerlaeota bacterium]